MSSRFQTAVIVRFSMRDGHGLLRLPDGELLRFTDAALQASAAEIEPEMPVCVQLGPNETPGESQVLRLWPGSPPSWALRSEWSATPAEALALLQTVGLARAVTAEAFAAACYQVRWDAMIAEYDIRDCQAQVHVRTVDPGATIAGLARIYSVDGPTPASLADHAFALTGDRASDPALRARVHAALSSWVGPLPAHPDLDALLADAADRLHRRGSADELYALTCGELRVIAIGRPAPLDSMLPVTRLRPA